MGNKRQKSSSDDDADYIPDEFEVKTTSRKVRQSTRNPVPRKRANVVVPEATDGDDDLQVIAEMPKQTRNPPKKRKTAPANSSHPIASTSTTGPEAILLQDSTSAYSSSTAKTESEQVALKPQTKKKVQNKMTTESGPRDFLVPAKNEQKMKGPTDKKVDVNDAEPQKATVSPINHAEKLGDTVTKMNKKTLAQSTINEEPGTSSSKEKRKQTARSDASKTSSVNQKKSSAVLDPTPKAKKNAAAVNVKNGPQNVDERTDQNQKDDDNQESAATQTGRGSKAIVKADERKRKSYGGNTTVYNEYLKGRLEKMEDPTDPDWELPDYTDEEWFKTNCVTCHVCKKKHSTRVDALKCFVGHKSHLCCWLCFHTFKRGKNQTKRLFKHYLMRHEQGKIGGTINCPYCVDVLSLEGVTCHIVWDHICNPNDPRRNMAEVKELPENVGRQEQSGTLDGQQKRKAVNYRKQVVVKINAKVARDFATGKSTVSSDPAVVQKVQGQNGNESTVAPAEGNQGIPDACISEKEGFEKDKCQETNQHQEVFGETPQESATTVMQDDEQNMKDEGNAVGTYVRAPIHVEETSSDGRKQTRDKFTRSYDDDEADVDEDDVDDNE